MKITIKREVEETYELEVPAYKKSVCHYFKILNEKDAISVCTYPNGEVISRISAQSALNTATKNSTKDEFYEKFNDVLEIISEK